MLTVDDLRNPERKSGFNHVHTLGSKTSPKPWRATAGRHDLPEKPHWRGPRRKYPEQAAQDYCDRMNGLGVSPTAQLKQAGHGGKRERLPRDPEVEAALGVLRDARAQRMGKKGYVYCISDGEYVKVGHSTNPKKRISELQTGNARLLRLVGTLEGKLEDEKAMQTKYAKYNILQEWFIPTPELLKEFKEKVELNDSV